MIPLICAFQQALTLKNIPTLTNPHNSLLRWLTLRAEVIKAQWWPGYKFFTEKWPKIFRKYMFLKKVIHFLCRDLDALLN